MQIESPKETIAAYTTQVGWLERKLERLKSQGASETDSVYTSVQSELLWVKNSLDGVRRTVKEPKGRLVQVLKSKIFGIRDKVGRVTYASADRNYASVEFEGGTFSHNLSLSNLLIIDLPVPTTKIPSSGMTVKFKDDLQDYVAVNWTEENVYVEPMSSVTSGDTLYVRGSRRKWVDRFNIETINGVAPL